ncbi:hypothetical protein FIBSPDRAFT_885033 [Athelia psychrophila]|uniref:Uncharacterized protein n=1 Tax=Athelia psychrophila TaxID=1759441 RepID=A0A166SBH8_9AGAM|nr:hypothetical protein FIBSPDRAFT_885033 [Fibularhizoctonia sp. CBS 109695]
MCLPRPVPAIAVLPRALLMQVCTTYGGFVSSPVVATVEFDHEPAKPAGRLAVHLQARPSLPVLVGQPEDPRKKKKLAVDVLALWSCNYACDRKVERVKLRFYPRFQRVQQFLCGSRSRDAETLYIAPGPQGKTTSSYETYLARHSAWPP